MAGASSKRGIRAAIFDLDGTLCDSLSAIALACNHALKSLGHEVIDEGEYRTLAGQGNTILMRKAIHRVTGVSPSDETVAEAVGLKRGFEIARGEQGAKAFAGAKETLTRLSKEGMLLAVLSNKVEGLVKDAVHTCFPDIPWVAVCGARDDVPLKPSPVAALRILNDHMPGILPGDTCFVGDTSVDMQTGLAAGMVPIGVSWGFRTRDELLEHGAIEVAKECGEIIDIIAAHGKRE